MDLLFNFDDPPERPSVSQESGVIHTTPEMSSVLRSNVDNLTVRFRNCSTRQIAGCCPILGYRYEAKPAGEPINLVIYFETSILLRVLMCGEIGIELCLGDRVLCENYIENTKYDPDAHPDEVINIQGNFIFQ